MHALCTDLAVLSQDTLVFMFLLVHNSYTCAEESIFVDVALQFKLNRLDTFYPSYNVASFTSRKFWQRFLFIRGFRSFPF